MAENEPTLYRDAPEPLYTAAAVGELDRQAIEVHGVPGYTLMKRAGKAAFEALQSKFPGFRAVTVLCGAGNNGGDGYVLARLAAEAGLPVQVCALQPPESLTGDAATAVSDYLRTGDGVRQPGDGFPDQPGLIVDALLGTGLDRPVGGKYAEAVEWINAADQPVIAIDIPSGLNADTGVVMGCAVAADITVTFIGRKQGLFTGDGPDHTGTLVFSDLSVPSEIYAAVPNAAWLIPDNVLLLPPRKRNSHKGSFGHVLAVGGSAGYTGAVRMCGEAALRCGAGMVSIGTHPDHAGWLNTGCPELMVHGVNGPAELRGLMERATVLAVGPGLGQGKWGGELLAEALADDRPCVLDADALNLLADKPVERENWVLTPHPGEAARLLGVSAAEIQKDRFAAASGIATRYNAVTVLKGCGSLVATPGEPVAVCNRGNPGMASAGMGDVLTGVIAALLAQGLAPAEAARAGVLAHAMAGDREADYRGQRGLLATDLLPPLRELFNQR